MKAQFTISFHIAPAESDIAAAQTSFDGQVGVPLSGSLGLSGGQPPYNLSVDDAAQLPPGVTLDSDGNVAGTPTAAGDFSVGVTVSDSGA